MKSFNHLVGAREEPSGNLDAERLRSLEVDAESEVGGLFDRQICRTRAFEDAIGIARRSAPNLEKVRRIGHESALPNRIAESIDRGQAMRGGKLDELALNRGKERIVGDDNAVDPPACKRG